MKEKKGRKEYSQIKYGKVNSLIHSQVKQMFKSIQATFSTAS
jgi:hypothetical protein